MVDAGRVEYQVGIDRTSLDRAINLLESRLAGVGDIDLKVGSQQAAAAVRQVDSLFTGLRPPEIDIRLNADAAKREVLTIESAIAGLRERRNEININIGNAQSSIAKLDADIKKLQDRKLIVEADSRSAAAQIRLIDTQLKELNDEAIRISADDDASDKLIRIDAQIEKLTARRIRLNPKVENIDSELAGLSAKIDGVEAKKIEIDADTRQARNEINRINETIKNLSGNRAQEELRDLQREYNKTGTAAKNAGKDTGSFNAILAGFSAGATSVLLDQLVNAFGALTAKVTEFVAASVAANASLRATENVLGIVLGSQEAASQSLDFLRQTSIETGQSFQALQNEYAGITAAAAEAGVPQEQVNDLFAETSRVLAIFGKDSTSTGLAFNALTQIVSKGVVSMEELRQQLGEQLPVAFGAVSRGLGITTAELNDLVSSGNLTAAEFIPAFTKGLKEIEGAAPPAQQAIAALQNSILEFQQGLGRTLEPLETAFSETFGAILDNVDPAAFDPLAQAAERLRESLAENPELAERLGEALTNVLGAGAEVAAELLDEITRILSKPENIERFATELEAIADTLLLVGTAAATSIDEILAIADAFTKVAEKLVPSLRLLNIGQSVIDRIRGTEPIEIEGSVNFDNSVESGANALGLDVGSEERKRLSKDEIRQRVQGNADGNDQITNDQERAARAAASAKIKADKEAVDEFKQANLDAISAIESAESNRIAAIRQNQAAGNITEQDAETQISDIEQGSIRERIALYEEEIAKVEDFASRKAISEEDAAKRIRKANEGIADLTLEATEKELEAQEAVAEAAQKKAEEIKKAILDQLDAQQRLNDLQAEQVNIQSNIAATALQDQVNLIGAQVGLEQSRLSLSRQNLEGKLAEAEAAENLLAVEDLRDRILLNQRQSIAAEFNAQREQLRIQEQLVQLDADRQLRLGQIAEAEARIAVERARAQGASAEEVQALQSIAQLRRQETEALQSQADSKRDILAIQFEQLDADEEIANQRAIQERREQAIESFRKQQKDLADEQLKTEKDLADATERRASAADSLVSTLGSLENVSEEDALSNLDQLEGNLRTARRSGVLDRDDATDLQSAIDQAQRFSRSGGEFSVDEAFRFASQNADNQFASGVLDAAGLGGVTSLLETQQEIAIADSQITKLTDKLDEVKGAIQELEIPAGIESLTVSTPDPVVDAATVAAQVGRQQRIATGAL